jgi:hypothetical protein
VVLVALLRLVQVVTLVILAQLNQYLVLLAQAQVLSVVMVLLLQGLTWALAVEVQEQGLQQPTQWELGVQGDKVFHIKKIIPMQIA